MKSVLFVCTANRYRSPFAAALFQKQLKENGKAEEWRVGSAGTWVQENLPAMPDAIQKAQEFSLNLGEHRSVEVNNALLSAHNLIVVMELWHKEALCIEFPGICQRVFLLSEIIDHIIYDVPDPAKAMDLDEIDDIFNKLHQLMQHGYSEICILTDEMSKT